MKKSIAILVFIIAVVNNISAAGKNLVVKDNSILLNGSELFINTEHTVFLTDMNEFREAKFIAAFPFKQTKGSGDWADVYRLKDGSISFSFCNLELRINGSSVVQSASKAQYSEIDTKDISAIECVATYAEPLRKYKYVLARDNSGRRYLLFYGK